LSIIFEDYLSVRRSSGKLDRRITTCEEIPGRTMRGEGLSEEGPAIGAGYWISSWCESGGGATGVKGIFRFFLMDVPSGMGRQAIVCSLFPPVT
jgi:hypothetical protein